MKNYSHSLIFAILATAFIFPQNIQFEQHAVDLNFAGIQYVKIVDIDGDDDLDIIGGSEITPYTSSLGIAYWRNDGGDPINWTKFVIDTSFIHVMSVDAAYIDADNHIDVVASSWILDQIAWWRNSGNPETDWTKHIVKSEYVNAHDAQCADIDQDQDTDIIAVNSSSGSVDIFYNQNINQPYWNFVQLDSVFYSAKSVLVKDLDSDTDLDIIGTAVGANDIAWWENSGINSQVWSKRIIANNFVGTSFADVVDINYDTKLDILATAWSSHEIAYWLCDDLQANLWIKNSISSNFPVPVRAFGYDFNIDNDIDVVVVSKMPGRLSLFINENFQWNEQVLYPNFDGGAALAVADLDDDGDKDIIAGATLLGHLYWWENKTINASVSIVENIPYKFGLEQNYPNPFNSSTKIKISIPQDLKRETRNVTLKVYDILGNEVATLVNEKLPAGEYEIEFNPGSVNIEAPSSIYFYRLKAGGYAETRKMLLLK